MSTNKQQATGMNIVSIDIETTGLSGKQFERNNSDLLEIGMVFYNPKEHFGKSFVQLNEDVHKVRIIVHRPTKYLQGNAYAFNMHWDTLLPLHRQIDEAVANRTLADFEINLQGSLPSNEDVYICKPDEVISKMMEILVENDLCTAENFLSYKEGVSKGIDNAITVAGKNVAGFDVPYLKDYIKGFGRAIKMRTRVYDPTVFFEDDDMDRLPSLDECLEMAREYNFDFPEGSVSHTAVEDAMDIVNLIHLTKMRGLYLKGKMKHISKA